MGGSSSARVPPCPRLAPRLLTAEAGRRSLDKRQQHTQIQLQAFVCYAMWACCDDTSSDHDDHNTSNAFMLLVAPVLLSGLTDLDELKVAFECRFVLDVFTIIQHGHPTWAATWC